MVLAAVFSTQIPGVYGVQVHLFDRITLLDKQRHFKLDERHEQAFSREKAIEHVGCNEEHAISLYSEVDCGPTLEGFVAKRAVLRKMPSSQPLSPVDTGLNLDRILFREHGCSMALILATCHPFYMPIAEAHMLLPSRVQTVLLKNAKWTLFCPGHIGSLAGENQLLDPGTTVDSGQAASG